MVPERTSEPTSLHQRTSHDPLNIVETHLRDFTEGFNEVCPCVVYVDNETELRVYQAQDSVDWKKHTSNRQKWKMIGYKSLTENIYFLYYGVWCLPQTYLQISWQWNPKEKSSFHIRALNLICTPRVQPIYFLGRCGAGVTNCVWNSFIGVKWWFYGDVSAKMIGLVAVFIRGLFGMQGAAPRVPELVGAGRGAGGAGG